MSPGRRHCAVVEVAGRGPEVDLGFRLDNGLNLILGVASRR